jgi:hypothetical protein
MNIIIIENKCQYAKYSLCKKLNRKTHTHIKTQQMDEGAVHEGSA